MARSNFVEWRAAVLFATVLAVVCPCRGQQEPLTAEAENSAASSPTAAALRQMTRSAWVIFAGQVIAVKRPDGYEEGGGGTVTVEFRVDEALRGCTSGSVYTLKEWAELWNASGNERYRVGQMLLMFLHRPGASGLSSPVHGAEGAVPLRGAGIAPGPYDTVGRTSEGGASEYGASEWIVDLRWVQAQAVRGKSEPVETPAFGRSGIGTSGIQRVRGLASAEAALLPVKGGDRRTQWIQLPSETDRALQPLAQVLSLCRGWMGPPHVDR